MEAQGILFVFAESDLRSLEAVDQTLKFVDRKHFAISKSIFVMPVLYGRGIDLI